MTDPHTPTPTPSASPLPTRMPLPSGPVVFQSLSTDHYPWTELNVDLEARQTQGFSGVYDLRQGSRWARFVLTGSSLRGFTSGGQEVSWGASMQAMPRARVTLTPLDAGACDLVWAFREPLRAPRRMSWPEERSTLEQERFTGALVAPSGCSYWHSGQILAGSLPAVGEVCLAFTPDLESDRAGTLMFWQELLNVLERHLDFASHWAQARVELTEEHPCLDPFAQEVAWEAGRLEVEPEVSVTELNAALTAVVQRLAQRGALRLQELPLSHLHRRPEWVALHGRSA